MDKSKIKTAAQKALIAADKSYYSWSKDQQEIFRATMSDAAQNRIEAILLKDLHGIKCTATLAGIKQRICQKLTSGVYRRHKPERGAKSKLYI